MRCTYCGEPLMYNDRNRLSDLDGLNEGCYQRSFDAEFPDGGVDNEPDAPYLPHEVSVA